MTRFRQLLTIIAIAAVSVTANAQPPQDPFNAVISTIVSTNTQIKSEARQMEAARLDAVDENSLSNPTVGFSRVWGRGGIGNKLQLDISQEFSWPGVYGARSRAAEAAYQSAEMALSASALEIALEAKMNLLELVYLRHQLDLLHRLKDNTDSVAAHINRAYTNGEMTILDVKKMDIERYKLESDIAVVEADISRVCDQIRSLCPDVALDLAEITEYPIEPILGADEYIDMVDRFDPVLAAGRFSAEQELLNARVATMQRYPSFTVGYQHQAEMGDRFNGFTLSMSLPFFSGRKAKAAALNRSEAAEMTNQSERAKRLAEVSTNLRDMEIWKAQTENYLRVFGDNEYMRLLLKAYKGGQINVIEFLYEVNYFYETTRAYLENQYRYRQALASLNRYMLLVSPQ